MAEIKVIAGLGNPGREYERTRHNIGFMTVDALSKQWGGNWKNWSGIALAASPEDHRDLALLKPQQYMNNSGAAVSQYARYGKIKPEEVLVVVDDFSLPLGAVRLRMSGSAGGHNGLSSIIEHFGTSQFPRLRLGIGPVPPCADPADYVLAPFASAERSQVETMVKDACAVIDSIVTRGLEKTISQLPKRQ